MGDIVAGALAGLERAAPATQKTASPKSPCALVPGPRPGPRGAGGVWANEFAADTVVRLDLRPEAWDLQAADGRDRRRKIVMDVGRRLWYMGRGNGTLGVPE